MGCGVIWAGVRWAGTPRVLRIVVGHGGECASVGWEALRGLGCFRGEVWG